MDEGPSDADLRRFSSETMACPHCGEEMYDEATVCPSCLMPTSDPPRKGHGFMIGVGVLLIVVLLLLSTL